MDPDATFKLVMDTTLPLDERGEAAVNLLGWMALGGGTPDVPGVKASHLGAYVVEQCKIVLANVLDIMPGGTARMLGFGA